MNPDVLNRKIRLLAAQCTRLKLVGEFVLVEGRGDMHVARLVRSAHGRLTGWDPVLKSSIWEE
jgi:hypothetical protein